MHTMWFCVNVHEADIIRSRDCIDPGFLSPTCVDYPCRSGAASAYSDFVFRMLHTRGPEPELVQQLCPEPAEQDFDDEEGRAQGLT